VPSVIALKEYPFAFGVVSETDGSSSGGFGKVGGITKSTSSSGSTSYFIAVTHSADMYIVNSQGVIARVFRARPGRTLVSACVSPGGNFIYALDDTGRVCAYAVERERGVQVHKSVAETLSEPLSDFIACARAEPVSVVHHPMANMLVTLSEDAIVRLWRK
jgi:hypothetical protein